MGGPQQRGRGYAERPQSTSQCLRPLPPSRRSGSSCLTWPPIGGAVRTADAVGPERLSSQTRKAHLRTDVGEDMHVALPPEDAQPGMCAKLRRGLYGARAAPA
eukprot:15480013-Alexandrium_andersonii.AAC.1